MRAQLLTPLTYKTKSKVFSLFKCGIFFIFLFLCFINKALSNTPNIQALNAQALAATKHDTEIERTQSSTIKDKNELEKAIIQNVHQFLEKQASNMGLDATIKVSAPNVKNLGNCDDFEVFSNQATNIRSRMTVSIRCLTPSKWVTHVHAELSVDGYYFISNRTIESGESIQLDDLIAQEADILRLSPHVITDPSQIIGFVATRRIPNGSTIRANTLRHPEAVARGQNVQTVARGPGFVVTSTGQALQSGNPGTRIQVRTPSGQIIQGIVLDATTVEILMF